MKVILIENNGNEKLGELSLETQPGNGEWVEFGDRTYSIHKIVHTLEGIKLRVIGVR